MYLPRSLLSHLYKHLAHTTVPDSRPVLILVSLDLDAISACLILTRLLKRDFIPHKVQPVAGYSELARAGQDLVRPLTRRQGGDGGVVICLGVGGLVDLEQALGLDPEEEEEADPIDHGIEVWLIDGRRPWNLQNVFGFGSIVNDAPTHDPDSTIRRRRGVQNGKILSSYVPGRGGVIVFDDGDIEQELGAEAEAFCALQDMPELGDEEDDLDASDNDSEVEDSDAEEDSSTSRKRKSVSDRDDDEGDSEDDENDRPRQRRRSNSVRLAIFLYEVSETNNLRGRQYRLHLANAHHAASHSKHLIILQAINIPLHRDHCIHHHLSYSGSRQPDRRDGAYCARSESMNLFCKRITLSERRIPSRSRRYSITLQKDLVAKTTTYFGWPS